jgi:N-sulfoglucosamine sulfohydrolase
MLDYAYEIEYFDSHLEKMLKILDARGELKNTIVVVTADNGMPFPRSKGLEYEYSNHIPLAIMWPEGIKKPGRTESSYVNFIDIAPTFLEMAGVKWQTSGMAESPGRSLKDIFDATQKKDRSYILLGQ